ncbi:MAG: HIRAN domain-containing protein [Solobacterium sp.]|nr:HIRAN domain-containing protein [Solobacterium sp.]
MNKELYITISRISDYAGSEAFRPGMKLTLKKDHDNPYDDEAIAVYNDRCKYGYVANCWHSVCRGTHSAGYIYLSMEEEAECRVCFVADEFAIAVLL